MPTIDSKTLSNEVKAKYSLVSNAFRQEVKTNPKDRITVEFLDTKQSEAYPQAKVGRWGLSAQDNEVNLSIRAPIDPNAVIETVGEVIKYKAPDYEVHLYDKPDASEDGGFELELHFATLKALQDRTTVVGDNYRLVLTTQFKNVVGYKQPPLTQEEIDEGAERPENIENSIAFYHDSKGGMNKISPWESRRNYIVSRIADLQEIIAGRPVEGFVPNNTVREDLELIDLQNELPLVEQNLAIDDAAGTYKEYKVGKVGHQYRIKLIGADGSWIWGDQNWLPESNELEVLLPKDWVDVYDFSSGELVVDPEFGNMSSGGSSFDINGYMFVNQTVAPEDGNVTSMSAYTNNDNSGQHEGVGLGFYNASTDNLVADSGANARVLPANFGPDWETQDVSGSISNGTAYNLGFWIGDANHSSFSEHIFVYYDTGDSDDQLFINDQDPTTDSWPATFDDTDVPLFNRDYFIYATYTAGGGGTEYTKELSEVITVTDVLDRTITKVFGEVVSLTDSLSRTVNRSFSEVVSLVDGVAKKTTRSLAEAVSLTDTINTSLVKLLNLIETITLIDYGEGLNDHSLSLDLSSNQYAFITDASQTGLDITGDLSIEAAFKLSQLPSTAGSSFTIVSKWDDGASQASYVLQIVSNQAGNDDVIAVTWSSDGTLTNFRQRRFYGDIGAGDVDEWVRLACTLDVSTETAKVYKNDVELTMDASVGSGATSIFDSSQEFIIGALESSGSPIGLFDGLIDEVRVWNDVRSPTELSDNGQSQLSGDEEGLVGYWKLNNDYTDSTSNGNDLTGSGSPIFSTSVPFNGGIRLNIGLVRILTETVTLVDSITRSVVRAFSEVVTLVDSLAKTPTRTLAEAVTLVDGLTTLKNKFASLSETITLVDSLGKSTTRTFSEVVSLTDGLAKSVTRVFAEAVTVADDITALALGDLYTKELTESISLVDSIARTPVKSLAETISLDPRNWLTNLQAALGWTDSTPSETLDWDEENQG